MDIRDRDTLRENWSPDLAANLVIDEAGPSSPASPAFGTTQEAKRIPVPFPNVPECRSYLDDDEEEDSFLDADETSYMSNNDSMICGSRRRAPRRLFDRDQLLGLRKAFSENRYPSPGEYEKLSTQLSMQERSVRLWFQNMRARTRKRGPDTIHEPTRAEKAQLYLHKSPRMLTCSTLCSQPFKASPPKPASPQPQVAMACPIVIKPEPGLGNEAPSPVHSPPLGPPPPVSSLVSPLLSDNRGNCSDSSRTPSPGSLYQCQSKTELSPATQTGFQSMTETVLPPDHPFCNLVQNGSTQRRRRRVRDTFNLARSSTHKVRDNEDSEDPEPPRVSSATTNLLKGHANEHYAQTSKDLRQAKCHLYGPQVAQLSPLGLLHANNVHKSSSACSLRSDSDSEAQPLDLSTKTSQSHRGTGPSGNNISPSTGSPLPAHLPRSSAHPGLLNLSPMFSMFPLAHGSHPLIPFTGAPMGFNYFGALMPHMAHFAGASGKPSKHS